MASNPAFCKEREETYLYAFAHTQTHAKEHMLNHHWSFPGNEIAWIKSLELNIREVQSSALTE